MLTMPGLSNGDIFQDPVESYSCCSSHLPEESIKNWIHTQHSICSNHFNIENQMTLKIGFIQNLVYTAGTRILNWNQLGLRVTRVKAANQKDPKLSVKALVWNFLLIEGQKLILIHFRLNLSIKHEDRKKQILVDLSSAKLPRSVGNLLMWLSISSRHGEGQLYRGVNEFSSLLSESLR